MKILIFCKVIVVVVGQIEYRIDLGTLFCFTFLLILCVSPCRWIIDNILLSRLISSYIAVDFGYALLP